MAKIYPTTGATSIANDTSKTNMKCQDPPATTTITTVAGMKEDVPPTDWSSDQEELFQPDELSKTDAEGSNLYSSSSSSLALPSSKLPDQEQNHLAYIEDQGLETTYSKGSVGIDPEGKLAVYDVHELGKRGEDPPLVTASSTSSEMSSMMDAAPRVSFSQQVHVHYHDIVLGDHPCSFTGPPISLGWDRVGTVVVPSNQFETARRQRSKEDLVLTKKQREQMLRSAGYSRQEIQKQVLDIQYLNSTPNQNSVGAANCRPRRKTHVNKSLGNFLHRMLSSTSSRRRKARSVSTAT